jgi:hypothetical protein
MTSKYKEFLTLHKKLQSQKFIINIESGKRFYEEAKTHISEGLAMFNLGMGGACSLDFQVCIDKCCAAIFSLFNPVPEYFGSNASRYLEDLYEKGLKGITEFSLDFLKNVEYVIRISKIFGSATMLDPKYRSQISNRDFLKKMLDAALDCLQATNQLLKEISLSEWATSEGPKQWVQEHNYNWDHQDWILLLEELRQSKYWPLDTNMVGTILEEIKSDHKR